MDAQSPISVLHYSHQTLDGVSAIVRPGTLEQYDRNTCALFSPPAHHKEIWANEKNTIGNCVDCSDRASVVIDSVRATVDKLSAEYSHDDLSTWRLPHFWRYMQFEDARNGDKPMMRPRRGTIYSGGAVRLGYLQKAIRDNGGPDWYALMEISEDTPYFLSAVPSGGQSWFINTQWKASPHINDQYEIHQKMEFKRVSLDREEIQSTYESLLTIRPN